MHNPSKPLGKILGLTVAVRMLAGRLGGVSAIDTIHKPNNAVIRFAIDSIASENRPTDVVAATPAFSAQSPQLEATIDR